MFLLKEMYFYFRIDNVLFYTIAKNSVKTKYFNFTMRQTQQNQFCCPHWQLSIYLGVQLEFSSVFTLE